MRVGWEGKGAGSFFLVSYWILSLSTVVQRTDYSFSPRITLMYLETDHICAQSSFLWTKCSWSEQSLPFGAVSVLLSFSKCSVSFLQCVSLSEAVLWLRPREHWPNKAGVELWGCLSPSPHSCFPICGGLHNLEFIALSLMCELRVTMPLSRSAIWPFISHSLK